MKPDKQKQILIYAGVAGAVLALIVLLKRKGSSSSPSEPTGTTYASSPGTIPAVGETGETTALRGELSQFENQLLTQLPGAIKEGVQAGATSNTAGGAGTFAESLSNVGTLLGLFQQNRTGEQAGPGAQQSPSQGTTPVQAAPPVITVNLPPQQQAPTSSSTPPPAKSVTAGCPSNFPNSGPHGCYHSGKCGNGCEGHFYKDGTTECQTKTKSGCQW